MNVRRARARAVGCKARKQVRHQEKGTRTVLLNSNSASILIASGMGFDAAVVGGADEDGEGAELVEGKGGVWLVEGRTEVE